MSSVKNPTLRRRTKELTECAEDARECQLLAYELKDIGRLIEGMAIHMGDLQRKVDSQAEHIKMLNEKLTADTPQTETQTETENSNLTFENRTMLDCYNCRRYKSDDACVECRYEPIANTPQTDCGWGKPNE